MHIGFPFSIDTNGRTRTVSRPQWLRGCIEQLLFTAPGERVNRPEFGSALKQMVFAPITAETSTGVQALIQGNLQRFLGDELEIKDVTVEARDSALIVSVVYADHYTGDQHREQFRMSEV